MTSARDLDPGLVPTLADYGLERLDTLCDGLGLPAPQRDEARALFRLVSGTWPARSLSATSPWENDITDDGTPFEFSVGFEGASPELRVLFESQLSTTAPSSRTSWQAGLDLQQALHHSGAGDRRAFDLVKSSFAPRADFEPRFSLWHAAVLRAGGKPLFKAYVNPEVHGVDGSRALAQEALVALGHAPAAKRLATRLRADTRLPYLSLDLEDPSTARVKVYLSASDADAVEELVRGTSNIAPGLASSWLARLTLGAGPFSARPILVCHAYRLGNEEPEATVHVPVRNYAPNDEEALRRTLPLLPTRSGEQLSAALGALSRQALHRSRGVLSYVSLRVVAGRVRVTTYLAPGAYTLAEERRESGTLPTGRPSSPPPP